MTKTIRISCAKAHTAIGISIWCFVAGMLLFGAYVQSVTLGTFDDSGDCHTAFFKNTPSCISDLGEERVFNKHEIEGLLNIYITLFIMVNAIGFIIANILKGWIKIECTDR